LLNRVVPEITELNDGETVAIRQAIGNRATLIGACIALPGGAIFYAFGAKAAGILWMALAATLITGRWLFNNQKLSFRGWVYWSTVPLLAVSVGSAPLLGGVNHSSAVLIWAFVAPVLNLTMLGTRENRTFFTAYFVCLILLAATPSSRLTPPPLPDWLERLMFLFNLGAAGAFLVVVFHLFITERERFRKQSERLLLNILPQEVAAVLKREHRVIATPYDNISVLFADLADFTRMSAQMTAAELVQLLDEVFSCFDMIVDKYDVEKIKTIGDCYMAAAGVPRVRPDHAEVLARVALDMRDELATRTFSGRHLRFRMGIHSGPVVAGVIGHKKFIYDIWGDTVNTASRMESHGVPDCIQITKATHDLIHDKFPCAPKGKIQVKGKGELEVWHLLGTTGKAPAEGASQG
jgi:adenylate cyclase